MTGFSFGFGENRFLGFGSGAGLGAAMGLGSYMAHSMGRPTPAMWRRASVPSSTAPEASSTTRSGSMRSGQ